MGFKINLALQAKLFFVELGLYLVVYSPRPKRNDKGVCNIEPEDGVVFEDEVVSKEDPPQGTELATGQKVVNAVEVAFMINRHALDPLVVTLNSMRVP